MGNLLKINRNFNSGCTNFPVERHIYVIIFISSRLYYYKTTIEPKLPAIQQLTDGLNIRGLLDAIKNNPIGFKACFVYSPDNLSLDRFFEEMDSKFSEKGSNKLLKEEDIFKYFCDYLEKTFYDSKFFVRMFS